MQTIIIVFMLLILALIALYNAFAFRLYLKKDELSNKIVHWIGAALRLSVIVFCSWILWLLKVPEHENLRITLLALFFSWAVYDLIYNKVNGHKWFYSGKKTVSVFDWLFRRVDELLKAAILFFVFFPKALLDTVINRMPDLVVAILLLAAGCFLAVKFHNRKV